MPKNKKESVKEEKEIEGISKEQHQTLNNLSLIMHFIRKKRLNEEQMGHILTWTNEALNDIKKL